MILIGIRISSYIELLNSVVNEAADYNVWSALYGEDWLEKVKKIKENINSLYNQRHNNSELEMSFTFFAGQLLKKIILHYLEYNYNNLDKKEYSRLIEFILTIDERLESELCEVFTEFVPTVRAWNK